MADPGGRALSRVDVVEGDGRGTWRLAGQLAGEVILAHSRAMPDVMAFSWTLYAVSERGLREVTVLAPARVVRLAGTAVRGGSSL
jgi:hypothetical protein